MALGKAGLGNIEVWDGDTIERHNLRNQMFKEDDPGRYKVDAADEIAREFSSTPLIKKGKMFVPGTDSLTGVVISAVDSLEMRQQIWRYIKDNGRVPLYIEARMVSRLIIIHTFCRPFKPEAIALYEAELFSNAKVHREACTERADFCTALVCAGLIGEQYLKFHEGLPIEKSKIIFDLKRNIFVET